MGLILRHDGAPFIDGEELPANDLEIDISRAVGEMAGNIESINLRPAAGLDAAKFADSSIRGDRIQDGALTTAKLATDSIVGSKFVQNTIQTAKIAATLTQVVQEHDTSDRGVGFTWATLDTVSITTAATTSFILVLGWALIGAPDTFTGNAEIRLSRGSTVFDTISVVDFGTLVTSLPGLVVAVDTTVEASTAYDYDLEASGPAVFTVSCDETVLIAMEFRR